MAEVLIANDRDGTAETLLQDWRSGREDDPADPDVAAALDLLALLQRRRGDLAAADALLARIPHHAPPALRSPVLVEDGATPPEDVAELRRWADANRHRFEPGRVGSERLDRTVRDSLVVHGMEHECPAAARLERIVRDHAPAAGRALGLGPLEVTEVEVRLSWYPDGSRYTVHVDAFGEDDVDRRLAYLVPLHTEPAQFSGGDLLVHDRAPGGDGYSRHRYTRVVPRPGRLVWLASDAPHQVTRVRAVDTVPSAGRLALYGQVRGRTMREAGLEAAV